MAKKDDLATALGGLVTPPDRASTPPDRRRAETRPDTPDRAGARQGATQGATADPAESQYRRTGTGYIKADGTEMVRTVLLVTRDERTRIKRAALDADLSPSDYVRRALGFAD